MNENLKKICPIALSALILSTSLLQAVDDAQMRNVENRLAALEQRKGANGMINPSARPQIREGADLFFTADFLYWKARQEGLAYAVKNNSISTTPNHAKTKNPHFKWEPGFRIGVGYNLPHDGWDLSVNWTRIYEHAHAHSHAGDGQELFTTFSHPVLDIDTVSKAKTHWKLHLNVLDASLGREFFVSKWLTLKPQLGLRTAWIHQRDTIRYKSGIGSTEAILPHGKRDVIEMKNNFWGIGPRAALDTLWGMGCGWSIYGNAAISLLYGHFHTHFEEELVDVKQIDVSNRFRSSKAIADLALGLRWDHLFEGDRYHLGIQAGWEQHFFFNQNKFTHFMNDQDAGIFENNGGDLTLQGWTLAARFDF